MPAARLVRRAVGSAALLVALGTVAMFVARTTGPTSFGWEISYASGVAIVASGAVSGAAAGLYLRGRGGREGPAWGAIVAATAAAAHLALLSATWAAGEGSVAFAGTHSVPYTEVRGAGLANGAWGGALAFFAAALLALARGREPLALAAGASALAAALALRTLLPGPDCEPDILGAICILRSSPHLAPALAALACAAAAVALGVLVRRAPR